MTIRTGALVAALLISTGTLVAGCTSGSDTRPVAGPVRPAAAADDERASPERSRVPVQPSRPREIPDLGPGTRAAVPVTTRQVLVVTGEARDGNRSTAVLYELDPQQGWKPESGRWPAHNALRGWTDEHRQGDLRSPIGVFGLTDAGGRLRDPGTRLPYDHGPAFRISGTGFEGEPLAGSFDHVVAINYNRRPGTSPLDWTRPLGSAKGGGIWIHVDHGGPTQGCVSLPQAQMKELLRRLNPALKPVVVMGDAVALRR